MRKAEAISRNALRRLLTNKGDPSTGIGQFRTGEGLLLWVSLTTFGRTYLGSDGQASRGGDGGCSHAAKLGSSLKAHRVCDEFMHVTLWEAFELIDDCFEPVDVSHAANARPSEPNRHGVPNGILF